jgi:hypothetical protein
LPRMLTRLKRDGRKLAQLRLLVNLGRGPMFFALC